MKNFYNTTISKLLKAVFTVAILLSGTFAARASHVAGADLTYTYLGNNQYRITYTMYRDCSGISAPTQMTLRYRSNSCNIGVPTALTLTMPRDAQTGQEISFNCPGVTSTCNGGSAPGFQQYTYSVVVTLNQQCADWQFFTSECCRNTATTLQNSQGDNLYIDAYLNNTTVNNNSPTFSNVPVAYVCIGQNNFYNHGVIDADGDSLVYSFIAPRDQENVPVDYASGYSIISPITSNPPVTINSQTGDIFLRPTQVEVGVIAVRILEYRNGELIGSVMRDLQVYTTNCQNTLPSLSGVNGSNAFSTSSCAGGQLCFNINSSDVDSTQQLVMTWNNGIPSATFTTSGGRIPTGTFCWTPTAADARPQPYTFTVTIRDNACPSNGVQTYSFSILVSDMNISVTSTPSVQCAGDNTGSASATASGVGPFLYLWSTGDTTTAISDLFAGPYSVQITDASGCVATRSFTITEPSALSTTVTAVGGGCDGTSTGLAIANPSGGAGNYSYEWSNGGTTQTIDNLASGTYSVVVTDGNGCTATGSATVNTSAQPDFNITSTNATCTADNGTATVSVTGGSGDYLYMWDPMVSANETATGLAAGTYSVIIVDNITGCSDTLSATIASVGGLSPTLNANGPTSICNGATVTLETQSGVDYTYQWFNGIVAIPGNDLNTFTATAAGSYSVLVTDQFGCTGTSNVINVTAGSATVPVISQSGTIGCLNNTVYNGWGPQGITLTATTPGAVSYLWSNGSTADTAMVTASGTYTVTITDASGCTASASYTVTINNVDIRCGRLGRKVLLCHVPEGNLGNPQTICIDSSAINAHLTLHDHDCLGPCFSTARVINEEGDDVAIYPNPSYDVFTVVCNFASYENTTATILDFSGRVVTSGPVTDQTFEVGSNLSPGVYYLHIVGEGKDVTLRMVKTSAAK